MYSSGCITFVYFIIITDQQPQAVLFGLRVPNVELIHAFGLPFMRVAAVDMEHFVRNLECRSLEDTARVLTRYDFPFELFDSVSVKPLLAALPQLVHSIPVSTQPTTGSNSSDITRSLRFKGRCCRRVVELKAFIMDQQSVIHFQKFYFSWYVC